MNNITKKQVTVDIVDLKMLDTESGYGGFAGYCSTFGNVDRNGDVMVSGAFTGALQSFIVDGFIALNHNWDDISIGTINKAFEDEKGLYVEAEFHSDAEAQRVRVWMAERLQRGKSVKMSIGFLIGEKKARQGGGFDITRVDELYEATIANVPVNPAAGIGAVKSFTLKSALGDRVYESMTLASLRSLDDRLWWKIYEVLCYRTDDPVLEEQITELELAFTEFQSIALKVIRAIMSGKASETAEVASKALKSILENVTVKAGRKLSKSSRSRIEPHIEALKTAADDLRAFLDESDADEDDDKETKTSAVDLPSTAQLRQQSLRIGSRISSFI